MLTLTKIFRFLVLAMFFFFVLTPVGVVTFLFFQPKAGFSYDAALLDRLSKLLSRDDLINALFKSIKIGSISATLATVIALLTAIALRHNKFPGRGILQTGTALPLIMPELVLAVGSLVWFSTVGIGLSDTTIIFAHVTLSVSFCILIIRARFQNHDLQLEEAARDLGAKPLQIFWRVTLPLILPGFIAAWLVAFNLSFDDFILAFFLSGPGSETLPVKLYNVIRYGVPEEIFTMSFVLILFASAFVVVLKLMGRRQTLEAFKA